MSLLAIDPGTTQSAFVILESNHIFDKGILPNADLIGRVYDWQRMASPSELAIEMIASYGMPAGRDLFETCLWIGRFIEAWQGPYALVYRKDIKLSICGSPRANDASIRQAIIDRFGGSRETAIGTKKKPGPLYGVSKDIWAALAVGLTFTQKQNGQTQQTPLTK